MKLLGYIRKISIFIRIALVNLTYALKTTHLSNLAKLKNMRDVIIGFDQHCRRAFLNKFQIL